MFRGNELSYEREARIENKIKIYVAKNNSLQVFERFQTYKISKKDSKAINNFQKRIQDTYNKFESEIDKVVAITKGMEYEFKGTITHEDKLRRDEERERNPEKYKEKKKRMFLKAGRFVGYINEPKLPDQR